MDLNEGVQPLCPALGVPVDGTVPKGRLETLISRRVLYPAFIEGVGTVGMCGTCDRSVRITPDGHFPGVAGCKQGFVPAAPPAEAA